MSATTVTNIRARQILDSRGRPTVEAEVALASGATGRTSVPSGASTGKAESVELRDGGSAWEGRGVTTAVRNVIDIIAPALRGAEALDQMAVDDQLRSLDGTPNLARLGANAVLAVSLANLRASAAAQHQPLHLRVAELSGCSPTMPLPMVNILSGGLHAGRGMDVQDFLVIPIGAASYSEALDWICRVRLRAAELCAEQGLPTLLADEGGLSPGFERSEDALDLMVRSFERAGLRPGEDAVIALDIASSSLVDHRGHYRFARLGREFSAEEMIALQRSWVEQYPIVSIEDGLGEDDWDNWPQLTRELGMIQLVGDDLFATQPERIRRALGAGAANSALIKVNQNGTFSGTLEAVRAAREGGYSTVISARSGETEDDFLADLAVGLAGGQIKIGSVRNSERLSKYNQLLRIEETGLPWSGASGLAMA